MRSAGVGSFLLGGRSVGHYRIIRRLAIGGMAEVYLGKRVGTGGFEKPVAIKRMLPSLAAQPESAEAFLAEARLCVHLVHPNVVQVLDLGTSNGTPWLVMELIDGEDLRRVLNVSAQVGRPFEAAEAIHITACVSQALAHADEAPGPGGAPLRVVHRDVNPSNVLISMNGEVKLADFGVAKAADGRMATEGNLLKGKLAYLAPELIRGAPASHSSDVFLAGVLLYELLSGKPLFAHAAPGQTLAQIAAHDENALAMPERAPVELHPVLRRALARDPARRYAHAKELARDLFTVLEEKRWRVGSYELAARMATLFPDRQRLDQDLSGGVILTNDRDLATRETNVPRQERTPGLPIQPTPATGRQTPPQRRQRLGEMLVAAGLLTDSQLQTLLARQRQEGGRLGEWVVSLDFASSRSVLRILARQLGVPFITDEKLLESQPSAEMLGRLPEEAALRLMALPVTEREGVFYVAMSEPGHLENLDLLRFRLGARVQPILCTEFGLRRAIARIYGGRGEGLKWRQLDMADPRAMLTTRVIDFDAEAGRKQRELASVERTPTPAPGGWAAPFEVISSQRLALLLPEHAGQTVQPRQPGQAGQPNQVYHQPGHPGQAGQVYHQAGQLPALVTPGGPASGYLLAYVPSGIGPDGQPTYVAVPVPPPQTTPSNPPVVAGPRGPASADAPATGNARVGVRSPTREGERTWDDQGFGEELELD